MGYSIEEITKKVTPIAMRYAVNKVSIFGSYARGEAGESSDIDLLIQKGRIRSLIDYFGFVTALEDSLGVHVDVVTDTIKDKDFLQKIRQDEVVIYDGQR